MKECARCRELKPTTEFRLKNPKTGLLTSYCIPCIRANSKAHYEANKAAYIARANARSDAQRLHRQKLLMEYFEWHPCVDCGETDGRVLEFDHLRDKDFNIGNALRDRPWDLILAEMDKCEVVCANCHRRRTARRVGYLRLLLDEAR